jgi:cytosine/uracil/thiamine/allantoin permease
MSLGRVALVITCLVVAGLGVWFTVAKWDDANKIATVASALGAVAAVGVAIWAAMRTSSGTSVRVSDTGQATGTNANTGFRGKTDGSVTVKRTGSAKASGGDANTGITGPSGK